MKYHLKNHETKEHVYWTLEQILDEINRDRSADWQPYNETDWQEGLDFTWYELIED